MDETTNVAADVANVLAPADQMPFVQLFTESARRDAPFAQE